MIIKDEKNEAAVVQGRSKAQIPVPKNGNPLINPSIKRLPEIPPDLAPTISDLNKKRNNQAVAMKAQMRLPSTWNLMERPNPSDDIFGAK